MAGHHAPATWAQSQDRVQGDVLEQGWSDKLGAFRQRYGNEALAATALLIPFMNFLPTDDARVRSTVKRIEGALRIEGLVHRFAPEKTPSRPDQPMGDREGAFLMCSMWLAEAWQMMGEADRAERSLARAELCRGSSRLFSEAGDARHRLGLLGNVPLLLTEAACARAARAIG